MTDKHALRDWPVFPDPPGSPAEVAEASDVVMMMVAAVDADQARAVKGEENGPLSAAHPGLTVVVPTTAALPVVHEPGGPHARHGVGFLDCGVTPVDKASDNGSVAVVDGEQATVDAALPHRTTGPGRSCAAARSASARPPRSPAVSAP